MLKSPIKYEKGNLEMRGSKIRGGKEVIEEKKKKKGGTRPKNKNKRKGAIVLNGGVAVKSRNKAIDEDDHRLRLSATGNVLNPIEKEVDFDASQFEGRKKIPYSDDVHPQLVYALCSEHGFSIKQLARVFGITANRMNQWLATYPELKQKRREGVDDFDSKHVEQMLLKRALGFEYKEKTVKRVVVKGKDAEGLEVNVPAKEVIEYTKYVPPETKAAQFWLTNRSGGRWKANQIHIDSVMEKKEVKVDTADLSKMSVEQLAQLRELITASAGEEGVVIPIECDDDAAALKQIEHFKAEAAKVVEAEYS